MNHKKEKKWNEIVIDKGFERSAAAEGVEAVTPITSEASIGAYFRTGSGPNTTLVCPTWNLLVTGPDGLEADIIDAMLYQLELGLRRRGILPHLVIETGDRAEPIWRVVPANG